MSNHSDRSWAHLSVKCCATIPHRRYRNVGKPISLVYIAPLHTSDFDDQIADRPDAPQAATAAQTWSSEECQMSEELGAQLSKETVCAGNWIFMLLSATTDRFSFDYRPDENGITVLTGRRGAQQPISQTDHRKKSTCRRSKHRKIETRVQGIAS